MAKIKKIVITGGPCAGKTTAMSWIQNAFNRLGYTVLFIPETATELITGGVAPWTTGTNEDYQKCQMRLQLEKEAIFETAAKTMGDKKILLVCDRGALDNKAYMNDEEFKNVLESVNKTKKELLNSYDAVFHLVTAAKGAERFYTTANNAARTETVDEAARLDDAIIASWTGHKHLRIVDNSFEFHLKIKRVVCEIAEFLHEKMPFDKGRRFLVKMPSQEYLDSFTSDKRIEVVQTYLNVNNNLSEVRVREREVGGTRYYYQTITRVSDYGELIEVEKRLSQDEYRELLWEEDMSRERIKKVRYLIEENNLYLELDVYPFWDDKAILELSLGPEKGKKVNFPKDLEVIREITDDPDYDNAAIAARR